MLTISSMAQSLATPVVENMAWTKCTSLFAVAQRQQRIGSY